MLFVEVSKMLKTEMGVMNWHIQLNLAAGESIGINSVTGSGKSTFLKILSGLMEPDTGMISFKDSLWWQKNPRRVKPT